MVAGRQYRSKLEMLRDFLAAAQTETRKTRIMNRANLNPVSFQHYLSYSLQRQLVAPFNGGFSTTSRAEDLIHSINQVLSKEVELRVAIDVLSRTARSGASRTSPDEILLRSLPQDPTRVEILRRAGLLELPRVHFRRN